MSPVRRAAVTGLFALWLAPLPSLAGSQSSNSSSNCSNGRCTQVESFVEQDRHGSRGWMGVRTWHEHAPPRFRAHAPPRSRAEPRDGWRWADRPYRPWGYAPRRLRDDDDD
jgi:hypothetical protein